MRISRILLAVAVFTLTHLTAYSSADCCTENPYFFSAQLLYWKATEDELEYVDKFSAIATTAIFVNGRPQDIDFNWDPGVRLSIGYACGLCDVALTWTHLCTRSRASTSAGDLSTDFLKPTWFPFLLGGLADRASASWRLHFNTLDLELGKEICLGQCVFLHPFTGLRAAWIDQRYRANYHGAFQFVSDSTTTTRFADTSFSARNDFEAIGLRFGIDANWCFCPCWALLGGVSTSLLYGRFHVKEVINGGLLIDTGTPGIQIVPEILTLKQTLRRPRYNIEGLLGLQYRKYFCSWKTWLAAAVSYEAQFWINQNQLINRVVVVNTAPITAAASNSNINESILRQQGNLQLSGFSFQLSLDKAF